MANFTGGSAPAMAGQIADGLTALSPVSLKSFGPADLASLRAELERLQRDVRGQVPPPDDAAANQARNRRITRLNSAIQALHHKMSNRRG